MESLLSPTESMPCGTAIAAVAPALSAAAVPAAASLHCSHPYLQLASVGVLNLLCAEKFVSGSVS